MAFFLTEPERHGTCALLLCLAGNRETSFVSSIQAAGITLAIARICSSGNVTRYCSCDTSVHNTNIEHNIRGKFSWGGCGDNFEKVRCKLCNVNEGQLFLPINTKVWTQISQMVLILWVCDALFRECAKFA